jgi:hypothetical protein
MENWKKKILLLDCNAKFNETQIQIVQDSVCEQNIKVKKPYDTTCFSYHINKKGANLKPKPSRGMPILFKMFGNSTIKKGIDHNKASTLPANIACKPCPGITKVDNQCVQVYLG